VTLSDPEAPGLLARARAMSAGGRKTDAAIPILEEAIRIADVHGDLALGFEARTELVDVACWTGHPDKMLVAFGWCLSTLDAHPDRFDRHTTYWTYKWVVLALAGFPEVSLAQIDAMLDDIGARYERIGASLRPIHYLRCWLSEATGCTEQADRGYHAWLAAPRDSLSDCVACETDDRVAYAGWRGRWDAALEHAAPLLAGRMRCAEVPDRTYARLLVPLLRLGRDEEAVDLHRRGIRGITRTHKQVSRIGDHLAFLALGGSFEKAGDLVERFLPAALTHADRSDRLDFLCDVRLYADLLVRAGVAEVRLALPRAAAIFDEHGRYAPAALSAWAAAEARALAERFDARNGNTHVSRGVVEHAAQVALARRVVVP
jgi:hypothetical protein